VRHLADATIIGFRHNDLSTTKYADETSAALGAFATIVRPERTVVDFEGVRLISPRVINGLLNLRKELSSFGGGLKIAGAAPVVREVFSLLNLEGSVLQIYDTVDDARDAFDDESQGVEQSR